MHIPIFFSIETVNNDKLQDVLMGKISLREAHELKARMVAKRKRSLTVLILCAAVFLLCAYLGLSYDKYRFEDSIMFVLLGGIFLPFFIAIFQFPGLVVALQYLGALKNCHPGSRITFTDYRKYNFSKVNEPLLKKISAYEFSPDEARGLLNMCNYNRDTYTRWAAFTLVVAAALAIFGFLAAPNIMAIEGETRFTLQLMMYFPVMPTILSLAVLLHLYRASICKRYINAITTTYTAERARERESLMDGVISELRSKTLLPAISITASRDATTAFSSKFGGTPYLPPGFKYPKAPDGKPLRLLAQLNFEELPRLPDFPESGILQFYAADNDMYGMNFHALNRQEDFRVIYHPEITRDVYGLAAPPNTENDGSTFPFEGELALYGEIEHVPISSMDFRFYNKALQLYNTAFSADAPHLYSLPSNLQERLFGSFSGGGHRVGGYPFFTQTDPRGASADFSGHTVLLLQIDSDNEIIWGDYGVANFFITPEKLRARDFSDVIYTWDCY